jgi:hemerythrin-like domain-containing protein
VTSDPRNSSPVLADALEEEHHAVDAGIWAYLDETEAEEAGMESLAAAVTSLRRHIYLEEAFLFPELRENGLLMPVMVMQREHARLWDLTYAIEAHLNGESDHEKLVQLCNRLLDELDSHNAKEEPIIYTKLEGGLRASTTATVLDFIAEGELPDSWVPQDW